MRRAITIQNELAQIRTVEDLTEVFESVASMHIARIRNHVVASEQFFAELWPTYRALRIDPKERVATTRRIRKGHNVFVAITSEGRLGSSTDEQIVDEMLAALPQGGAQPDIFVVGSHGFSRLQHKGVAVAKAFTMPSTDSNFSLGGIIDALETYEQISVFYQQYESLRSQKIVRIELLNAVRELGEGVEEGELVSSRDYIFEPSISEIATYMESLMMGVAMIQVMMESKLAGYAVRFNNMSRAKQRAKDLVGEMRQDYFRTKRSERDERLQEIMKVVKHGRN